MAAVWGDLIVLELITFQSQTQTPGVFADVCFPSKAPGWGYFLQIVKLFPWFWGDFLSLFRCRANLSQTNWLLSCCALWAWRCDRWGEGGRVCCWPKRMGTEICGWWLPRDYLDSNKNLSRLAYPPPFSFAQTLAVRASWGHFQNASQNKVKYPIKIKDEKQTWIWIILIDCKACIIIKSNPFEHLCFVIKILLERVSGWDHELIDRCKCR